MHELVVILPDPDPRFENLWVLSTLPEWTSEDSTATASLGSNSTQRISLSDETSDPSFSFAGCIASPSRQQQQQQYPTPSSKLRPRIPRQRTCDQGPARTAQNMAQSVCVLSRRFLTCLLQSYSDHCDPSCGMPPLSTATNSSSCASSPAFHLYSSQPVNINELRLIQCSPPPTPPPLGAGRDGPPSLATCSPPDNTTKAGVMLPRTINKNPKNTKAPPPPSHRPASACFFYD